MKKLIYITIIAFLVASCSKKGNFSIEGYVTNAQNSTIYLERLEINGSTTPFDSVKIGNNGHFKLSGSVSYPTFFLFRLNDNKFVTLLVDSLEKIAFSADIIDFDKNYKISGSQGSEKVQELTNYLKRTNSKIDSINSLLRFSRINYINDIQKNAWISEINAIVDNQITYSKNFVANNPFSLASVLAIYQRFNNGEYIVQDLHTIKVAASALKSMYPNSPHAQSLYSDTELLMKNINSQKLSAFMRENSVNSPDIILPNVNGKDVALSSLLGKVVLLQFWTATDLSCLMQNDVLKENYALFNSKGFEIYQVSIDVDSDLWKKTIADKSLKWIHVGDMKGSESALISYNIKKVPSNYLIGKDGSILGRDLFGPALQRKLNEILN